MSLPPPAATSSPPPSPGLPPVKLSDCIEELLHYTLSSYLPESPLDDDQRLSDDYCSRLLQIDDPHPLYKQLARNLETSIKVGSLGRDRSIIDSIRVDEEKARTWAQLIAEKGAEILNMLESVDFEMHVQEPYFTQLRDGLKTVEVRCAVGNYNRIVPGALLLFNKCLLLKVQHVNRFNSFAEMLKVENLSSVLPGVDTIEEGVQIYRKFYSEEKESVHGVLAISVSKLTFQPYTSMTKLLSGLSYDGIGDLLGVMHTAGTVPNALPPPRSVLIASSMKLHHPDAVS